MSKLKGQILLVTLFALAMAMTVLFFLYTPIRNQILRMKAMDYSFSAIARAISGLEISFYEVHKGVDLSDIFQEEVSVSNEGVDPIYCDGQSSCQLRLWIKKKEDRWIRTFKCYYVVPPGSDCSIMNQDYVRFFLTSQGEDKQMIRSLFFTF